MVAIAVVILGCVTLSDWGTGEHVETDNREFGLSLFEQWGIVIIMVGIVLFTAMLGGVFIAQEEGEE